MHLSLIIAFSSYVNLAAFNDNNVDRDNDGGGMRPWQAIEFGLATVLVTFASFVWLLEARQIRSVGFRQCELPH
jgi:hypothetical protein